MSNKKNLIILISCVSFFILFILLRIFLSSGNNSSQVVVPRIISDDFFYYARAQEINDGYPMLGNPFYLEHRLDTNSTFVLPDWIASIPYAFDMPIFYSFAINLFIWAIFTALALYYLFSILKFSPRASFVMSFLVFLSTTTLFFRPTIMQVIYPFFILGMALFYYWLAAQPKKYLLFVTPFFLAFTLYFYQHLAVMFYFLAAVIGVYLFFSKKFKTAFQLAGIVVASLIIALPVLRHYYFLFQNPVFNELLLRIDDAFTRQPSFFVFMTGKWVVVGILIWLVLRKLSEKQIIKNASTFFIIFGIASILASMSNVLTGVRVETAEHIYRFQKVYIVISIFIPLAYLMKHWRSYLRHDRLTFSALVLFLTILSVPYFSIASKSIARTLTPVKDIQHWQDYDKIILAINTLPDESVIWANDELSAIIPIYSNHYDLFARDGSAYLVPNDEIQERYLLDHVFDREQPDFESNIGLIIGYGNEFDFYKEHNRWVGFCKRFNLPVLGFDCGRKKSTIELVDKDFFIELKDRFDKIKNDYLQYLNKYQVDYLIIDRQRDYRWYGFNPTDYSFELIYNDGRFEVYKLAN